MASLSRMLEFLLRTAKFVTYEKFHSHLGGLPCVVFLAFLQIGRRSDTVAC